MAMMSDHYRWSLPIRDALKFRKALKAMKYLEVTTVPITYGYYLRVRAYTSEARDVMVEKFCGMEPTRDVRWMKGNKECWYDQPGAEKRICWTIHCNVWYSEYDQL